MKINNISKYLLLGAVSLTALWACNEDKLLTYDNDNDVFFTLQRWDMPKVAGTKTRTEYAIEYDGQQQFFSWSWTYQVYDSLYRTYFYFPEEVTTDRVFIPLSYMGTPKPYDRQVGYTIAGTTTARENTDYRILDAIVPANSTVGAIVVEVLLDGLDDMVTRHIDFKLTPNDEFTTNFTTTDRSRTDKTKASMTDFRLTLSKDVLPPYDWYEGSLLELNTFGKFSKKKFLLLLEVAEVDPAAFYHTNVDLMLDALAVVPLAGKLAFYLQTQRTNGTPVYEEDGVTLMTLPGL